MKILHIISSAAAGGAEVYVKDLAIALAKENIEVFIGFLDRAEETGRDADFQRHFLRELEAYNIKYFFLGRSARRNPALGALRIRRFVKSHDINVYHSHLKFGVLFGALLNVPRVYTHHSVRMGAGFLWSKISNLCVEQYVGISLRCSEALSNFTRREVQTIFNGVSSNRLQGQIYQRMFPAEPVRFLSVGRIHPAKNYELLIKSISFLPEVLKRKCQVLIAGEGDQEYVSKLKDMARVMELSGCIKFLGNRSDIPILLGQADLFLMTSSWEGLPISLLEATISGLPCIVTDVGGNSEIVQICKNGLVVEPDNPWLLASAMEMILADRKAYVEYSANALRKSSGFYIEVSVEKHLALYRTISA